MDFRKYRDICDLEEEVGGVIIAIDCIKVKKSVLRGEKNKVGGGIIWQFLIKLFLS